MDIITKSHFEQFKKQYGYENKGDSDAFELFSIYCIVSKYIKTDTISRSMLDDLNIGNGGDWGIDGFIIIVNGKIITSQQEVDDLLSANGTLHVKMVLVQAKTSQNFNVAELGQFLDGAEYVLKDVLGHNDLPSCNEDLIEYRNLVKYIYSKSADFDNGNNPSFEIYYVTCGDYNGQADFVARISKTEEIINNFDLTSGFKCHMLGKKEIVGYYKDTKSKIEVDIKVEQKISLPEIKNVEQSFLCLIPFKEFRKLIIGPDSKIIHSVFYDNIRSFQGDNSVNKAMSESLKKGDVNLFAAMNNGITVIAKGLITTGTNVHLSDYQIVNGCQTSNVLQQNLGIPNIDELVLTVKIISSKDKEIRDKIIVGNNSQTEVKREQLVALLDTQKYIEDYYNAQNKYEKLYYERRSKQYRFDETQIPSYKVITIPFQIKAFVSMAMGEPHKVSGYYGSIVEQFDKNGIRVFAPETNPALYYTSALACYKMTESFNNNIIPRKYKKVKFHLLLAFRLMCEKDSQPQFNSNKVQSYCDYLCEILCDSNRCQKGFEAATKLIDTALKREPKDQDRMSKNFTDNLFRLSFQINKRRSQKK